MAVGDPRLPIVAVVEDDLDLAAVYEEWLQTGNKVRLAHSAEEARMTIDGDVDIVILDRKLPGTSGDELLNWIREEGYRARVAMITAVSPDFDVIDMGLDTYVEKPITKQGLRDLVKMLLTRTVYDQRVQRYLELVSKQNVLENKYESTELQANQGYENLSNELCELRAELNYLLRNLDDEYFDSEQQAVVVHSREGPV